MASCCSVFVMACLSLVLSAPTKEVPVAVTPSHNRYLLDTESLDFNKDGCIDGKEETDAFIAHVSSLLPRTPSNLLKAHSIVHRSDVNKDGRICWCDFVAIYLQDKDSKGRHSAPFTVIPDTAMFVHLDIDLDGQLKDKEKDRLEDEFSSCLGADQSKLIVRSMEGEVSKNDAISLEEYEKFMIGSLHHGSVEQEAKQTTVQP
ncbi:hypothetical protein Btru_025739 [Bulinus truncatus]|nr:hypothetical protein Btru_025739 [Bulinus truncatus]